MTLTTMNNSHADITVVLDRSGSMGPILEPTISGFNKFLNDQKKVTGTATITLHQFDDQFDTVINACNIQDASELTTKTYIPRGSTALLDAIGKAINLTGKRLELTPEATRAGKVIFVIQTDGLENASREFTRDVITAMIRHQESKYMWEFVFLGAGIDSFTVAAAIGITTGKTMTYMKSAAGSGAMFDTVSGNLGAFRCGVAASMDFNAFDYSAQEAVGLDAVANAKGKANLKGKVTGKLPGEAK